MQKTINNLYCGQSFDFQSLCSKAIVKHKPSVTMGNIATWSCSNFPIFSSRYFWSVLESYSEKHQHGSFLASAFVGMADNSPSLHFEPFQVHQSSVDPLPIYSAKQLIQALPLLTRCWPTPAIQIHQDFSLSVDSKQDLLHLLIPHKWPLVPSASVLSPISTHWPLVWAIILKKF